MTKCHYFPFNMCVSHAAQGIISRAIYPHIPYFPDSPRSWEKHESDDRSPPEPSRMCDGQGRGKGLVVRGRIEKIVQPGGGGEMDERGGKGGGGLFSSCEFGKAAVFLPLPLRNNGSGALEKRGGGGGGRDQNGFSFLLPSATHSRQAASDDPPSSVHCCLLGVSDRPSSLPCAKKIPVTKVYAGVFGDIASFWTNL